MSWLRNIKLGAKIIAGYAIALTLTAVVGVLAYVQLNAVQARFSELAGNLSQDRQVANDLQANLLGVRLAANQYLRLETEQALLAFGDAWEAYAASLAAADEAITKPERVALLKAIHTHSEAYRSAFDEVTQVVARRQSVREQALDPQATLAQDSLNQLAEELRQAGEPEALYQVGLAQEALQRMRVNMLKYLDTGEAQWVTRFDDRFSDFQAARQALSEMEAGRSSGFQTADAAVEAYATAFQGLRADYARQLELEAQLDQLGPQVREAGQQIVDSVIADALVEEQATTDLVTQTQWVVLATLAVAVVIGLSLGLVITRGITLPLKTLTQAVDQIARTDLPALAAEMAALAGGDLTRRVTITAQAVDLDGRDETGQMAQACNGMIARLGEIGQAFDTMSGRLRQAVGQVAESAASVGAASGQLAAAAGQAGQATSQIATTIQQVARGTQQQSEGVSRTAASVEQMKRAIDGVAKGAQEQAAAVGKASTITAQITTAIQQVAGNAEAVNQEATGAANAARTGSRTVEAAIAGMSSIKAKVGASAAKVREMGQRSDQIGAIVETIDDIASQTNLLALNAAIEAARAGEHGKGFAVVADEVRKLAERASAATKEIGGLIRAIQSTVGEAVRAMDEGAAEVAVGAERANEAGEALAQILKAAEGVRSQAEAARRAASQMGVASNELVGAMDAVSAVVEENTAATEEMAAGSSEVTQAIENIASISGENSAAVESASAEEMSAQVEEVTASAQSLSDMARTLQAIVAQFTLTEAGQAAPVAQVMPPAQVTPPARPVNGHANGAAGRTNGRRHSDLPLRN